MNAQSRTASILAAPAVVLTIPLFVIPLIGIMIISFTDPSLGLQNYRMLLENEGIRSVLIRTFWLSSITAIVAIFAGYVIAYAMFASSSRVRLIMLFFILVPFWVSALSRAFSWIILLGRNGPVNTVLMNIGAIARPISILYSETGVTLAMIHYMLPYAILPLFTAMKDIDLRLLSASRGLGATPTVTFTTVFLPITFPGIVSAFTLVFIYSLGFYVIPAIVGGGRVPLIGQYISMNVLDTVRWGVASMLSVTLLVTILLLGITSGQLRRLTTRKST